MGMIENDISVAAGHIAYEQRGALGLIRLTRPEALNALTHDMVRSLARQLDTWAERDDVRAVAITGEGKAFSAGGDIRAIYERGMAGEPYDEFFADEYALNIRIKRYPKPYVAFIDGIAMGGGVGVSYHGSHRVVGERARFAMPECGIGFFPDVGGSYLLSRLPKGLGAYLGLTGHRLGPAEQIACGLATHFAPAQTHETMIERLTDGANPDEALESADAGEPNFPVGAYDLFESTPNETLNELLSGTNGHGMSDELVATLRKKSPTSLAVTSFQLSLGAMRSFERCMAMEAGIAHRMLRREDFYSGIRAAIIDKSRATQWSPNTMVEVSDQAIDDHFQLVEDGPLARISVLERT